MHTIFFFRSLGIQESNALNDVQIRVEKKKLWPFEDNCTKLKGHFKMIYIIYKMDSKKCSKFVLKIRVYVTIRFLSSKFSCS